MDVQLLEFFRRQFGAGLAEGVDELFEIAGAPPPLRSLPRRGGSVGAHCGGGRRLFLGVRVRLRRRGLLGNGRVELLDVGIQLVADAPLAGILGGLARAQSVLVLLDEPFAIRQVGGVRELAEVRGLAGVLRQLVVVARRYLDPLCPAPFAGAEEIEAFARLGLGEVFAAGAGDGDHPIQLHAVGQCYPFERHVPNPSAGSSGPLWRVAMGRQADGLPHLPKPGTWPCSNSSARTGALALEWRISLRASSAPTGETP